MHPLLEIVEGPVSPDGEHMSLSYGSFNAPGRDEPPFPEVARVSPPQDGVIMLELLIDDSTTHDKEIITAVRSHVHWLFVEKREPNPWAYARYHCTTSANIYSRVHWSWVSGSNDDRG